MASTNEVENVTDCLAKTSVKHVNVVCLADSGRKLDTVEDGELMEHCPWFSISIVFMIFFGVMMFLHFYCNVICEEKQDQFWE